MTFKTFCVVCFDFVSQIVSSVYPKLIDPCPAEVKLESEDGSGAELGGGVGGPLAVLHQGVVVDGQLGNGHSCLTGPAVVNLRQGVAKT